MNKNRIAINSEVIKLIENLRLEIAKLHIDRAMKTMKNTNTIRNKQKEIARLFSSGVMPIVTTVKDLSKAEKKEEKKN